MNIQLLQDVLETISVAGINEVVFSVSGGDVLVSGIDENNSVIVFSKFDNSDFVHKNMGIFRTLVLIKRLKLFDLSTADVQYTDHNDYINTLVIKQHKKSVSYTFANPGLIRAPKNVVEDNTSLNKITIDNKALNELIKAAQALHPEFISFSGNDDDIVVELKDQVNDKYENTVGTNKTGNWKYKWKVDKLLKLLKYELKNSEEAKIVIDSNGFLKVVVNNVKFILPQQI
jgi:hypothetical protein